MFVRERDDEPVEAIIRELGAQRSEAGGMGGHKAGSEAKDKARLWQIA